MSNNDQKAPSKDDLPRRDQAESINEGVPSSAAQDQSGDDQQTSDMQAESKTEDQVFPVITAFDAIDFSKHDSEISTKSMP